MREGREDDGVMMSSMREGLHESLFLRKTTVFKKN